MKDSVELVGIIENIIYSYNLVSLTAAVQFAWDWSWGKSVKSQQLSKKLKKNVAGDQQPNPIVNAAHNHIFTIMTAVNLNFFVVVVKLDLPCNYVGLTK